MESLAQRVVVPKERDRALDDRVREAVGREWGRLSGASAGASDAGDAQLIGEQQQGRRPAGTSAGQRGGRLRRGC